MFFHIFFFFNDTATTEIYTTVHTLSLQTLFRSPLRLLVGDRCPRHEAGLAHGQVVDRKSTRRTPVTDCYLVCRLLLEKKKKILQYTRTRPKRQASRHPLSHKQAE